MLLLAIGLALLVFGLEIVLILQAIEGDDSW
jgi:hypothetical protein